MRALLSVECAAEKRPSPTLDICRTHIDHPSAWRGTDFASRDDFAIDLGPRHLHAFERALEDIRAAGLGLGDIERRHFEVPEIALVMHARTAFEDDVEAGYRRHLLRLWLDVPGGRPAPKEMHIHSTAGIARQEGKTPTGEGDAYKALLPAQG